jgi:SnoaL-like domain
MSAQERDSPSAVIERLREAQNRHDLEAFVASFAPDYRSEQPAHPARTFGGRDQVRQNWAEVFTGIPDFRADLLAASTADDTGRLSGAGRARTPTERHSTGGRDRVRSAGGPDCLGRQYMEPVEEGGAGIDDTVRNMAAGP